MHLPGRLRTTTFGDLLGGLHRAASTGTLELTEPTGRAHRVHLACGLVSAVEIDRASPCLAEILRRDEGLDGDTLRRSLLRAMASRRLHGEVLVHEFHISPEVVDRALRRQLMTRLHALDELRDAQVTFHVAVRPPRSSLSDRPLAPVEFLHGRRRARDAEGGAGPARRRSAPSGSVQTWDPARARAYSALGLSYGADPDDIKRAYRRLVRTYHPDLHPGVSAAERSELSARFSTLTDAYRALVA